LACNHLVIIYGYEEEEETMNLKIGLRGRNTQNQLETEARLQGATDREIADLAYNSRKNRGARWDVTALALHTGMRT
jgi:hypothetical protein